MTSKIFRSTIFVAAVVLLCSLGIILGMLYRHFSGVQVEQLRDELSLAATGTEQFGTSFLENVEGERFRVTWIAGDGSVLFDTRVAADSMGNHLDREEVSEALSTGSGSSARYSDTLMEKTLYEAVRLSDGSILRISTSQASAAALGFVSIPSVALIAGIAIVLSAILARRMAKKIVEPLNRLDLEHPLNNNTYEELTPLLQRINRQHNQIRAHIQTLTQRADEFHQITANMKEGLVLLSSEGNILSINPTARAIFGADGECIGKSFLMIDRSWEMREAVNAALDTGYGTARANRGGKDYQFDLSRIESGGNVIGAVVLAFDITQSLHAEQTRREFSANVSHELKTPLQSIIGSAELMETGLVKPEDTARFVSMIRAEAKRLVSLVEDIIRLSQLDEGVELPPEDTDLLALAQEAAATLQNSARDKGVSVRVRGEHCVINGVRRLLYEIVSNLCDNAVKYNVPGGSVEVTVENKDGHPVLTVADTGIGILPEHTDRVFERFYRVDKSHSRQSGGTGLGLSIVKHAVAYHGGSLELSSTPGKGTTVKVIF